MRAMGSRADARDGLDCGKGGEAGCPVQRADAGDKARGRSALGRSRMARRGLEEEEGQKGERRILMESEERQAALVGDGGRTRGSS